MRSLNIKREKVDLAAAEDEISQETSVKVTRFHQMKAAYHEIREGNQQQENKLIEEAEVSSSSLYKK